MSSGGAQCHIRKGRGVRLLFCDMTSSFGETSSPDEAWIHSPLQCLDKAVDGKPEIIVVRFGNISLQQREALLELCTILKRNSHTRNCIVIALLHSKHRTLLERLDRARVDYVRYVGESALESSFMAECTKELGPNDRLETHLFELCPFIHYSATDHEHEIPFCGAYLDRLVLGGHRLHQICHTADHHQCEYYRNPRSRS